MRVDSTDQYVLCAKTGWAKRMGWYIGFLESTGQTWVFALNMDISSEEELKYREELTFQTLQREHILPE